MEDFFGIVMVIIGIVAAISKNKKKKVESIRKRAASTNHPTVEQTMAEWFNVPQTASPAQKQPAAVEVPTPQMEPAPRGTVQPRVKTTVAVKEKPSAVVGSLGVDSHEGLHPCDEHDEGPLQEPSAIMAASVEKPGIQLDWSGDNMVKALIMQEVLTRPQDRRRRA